MKINQYFLKTFLLFFFICIGFSCSSKDEIKDIDQLIQQGHYKRARTLLKEILKQEWTDTLQYKRLKYRLIKVEIAELFNEIDSIIKVNNALALRRLVKLEDSLKNINPARAKYYYFDLYWRKANILKNQGNDSLWFVEISKALNTFTDRYQLKRSLYEECAFYLAQKGEFDHGLKMIDASFRSIDLTSLHPFLKKAYYAYFNGKFAKALKLLQQVPEKDKDQHWLNLENYLKNYGHRLSIEERFKLW